MKLRLLLVFTVFIVISQAANIIFLNVWHSKSHGRTMMYLAESLVRRGHNVTMYSQVAAPIGPMGKGVVALESQLTGKFDFADPKKVEKLFWFTEMTPLIFNSPQQIGYNFYEKLINDTTFHNVLNTNYSLAIIDEMFISAQAAIALKLKEKFDTKISIFSTTDLFAYSSHYRALSRNPVTYRHSYVKGYDIYDSVPESFYLRLMTVIDVLMEHPMWEILCDKWIVKAGKLLGVESSGYKIYKEAEVTFTDYPQRYGSALPTSFEIKHVGEHCQDSSKLPEDIATFVEDPTSLGTVYVAFGSIVNWNSAPISMINTFVKVFNSLKDYRVIWSYTGPELQEAGPNIKILKWAPQNDILTHPKTVLFFTHGGLKSIREGICSNTPLLFLPFFADQCKNAAYAIEMHLAEAIYKKNITEVELGTKIRRALSNEKMKTNIAKLHNHFTDNVIDSLDLGVFWTEKMLRTGELAHSRIRGRELYWIQFFHTEIILTLLFSYIVLY